MINVDLDKSVAIRLRARVNESSVPVIFTFRNSTLNPVDITSFDFKLLVYKNVGSSLKLFTLSIGAGLTVIGSDLNQLKVEITSIQAKQKADTYFFRLYSSGEDHTWLNGPFVFHQGEFESTCAEGEITISTCELFITIGSGSGVGDGDHFIDGGTPFSIYTGTNNIDGGNP